MTAGSQAARAAVHTIEAPTRLESDDLAARAHMYRLLSASFVEEPDRTLIGGLRSPQSLAELAEIGVVFDGDFLEPDLPALLDALGIEYACLFLASGGFPPIESVRLTGHLQQEPHFRVKAFYRKAGFEVGRARFHVEADQLGAELAFVATLLERAAEALRDNDRASAARLDKDVKRFWSQHLGKWVRGYAGLVAAATEHSFYREMAQLLRRFADEEIVAMGLRVDDEDEGRWVVPKAEPQVEHNPDEPVCTACPTGKQGRLADLAI